MNANTNFGATYNTESGEDFAVEVYRGRMDVAYESYAAYFAQCILHWGLSGKYIISDPSVVPEPLKRYQNPS